MERIIHIHQHTNIVYSYTSTTVSDCFHYCVCLPLTHYALMLCGSFGLLFLLLFFCCMLPRSTLLDLGGPLSPYNKIIKKFKKSLCLTDSLFGWFYRWQHFFLQTTMLFFKLPSPFLFSLDSFLLNSLTISSFAFQFLSFPTLPLTPYYTSLLHVNTIQFQFC